MMAGESRSSGGRGNQGIVVNHGNLNAGQVAVGDRARAAMSVGSGSKVTIGSHRMARAADREAVRAELLSLLRDLDVELRSAPGRRADAARKLAAQAGHLVKAATVPEPNPSMLQYIGRGLKETALFLNEAVPRAVRITSQILYIVSKLHGLGL